MRWSVGGSFGIMLGFEVIERFLGLECGEFFGAFVLGSDLF